MLWRRVENEKRVQPNKGSWPSWKDAIAKDCCRQCVYCAIPDSRYGGLDNFHVDHFRPKAKFPALAKIITNLYLACAICNRFKSDDWPADPSDDHDSTAYPDPGVYDYGSLIELDNVCGTLTGKYVATAYMIERLFLNRPQLIRLRRAAALEDRIESLETFLATAIDKLRAYDEDRGTVGLLVEVGHALMGVSSAFRKREHATPYGLNEIRKPKRSRKAKKPKGK
jgi:hypothetical protein